MTHLTSMRNLNKLVASLMVAALFAAAFFATSPAAKAADVTGSATINGGTLSITGLIWDEEDYYSVNLDGVSSPQDTSKFTVSVTDATGTGKGWELSASMGALTGSAGTIPSANHTITSRDIIEGAGTAPEGDITPGAFPTSETIIFTAAPETGLGSSQIVFNTNLVVPVNAKAGTYTATLTVTIAAPLTED